MVLVLERDVGFEPVIDGGGADNRIKSRTALGDGDDPRDLLYHLTAAIDGKKRPGVKVSGDSNIGAIYTNDVFIDYYHNPVAITEEGVTESRTSVMVSTGLGWLCIDNDGIREPAQGFAELGTPTIEEARLIAYDALQTVLANPPQISNMTQAA